MSVKELMGTLQESGMTPEDILALAQAMGLGAIDKPFMDKAEKVFVSIREAGQKAALEKDEDLPSNDTMRAVLRDNATIIHELAAMCPVYDKLDEMTQPLLDSRLRPADRPWMVISFMCSEMNKSQSAMQTQAILQHMMPVLAWAIDHSAEE